MHGPRAQRLHASLRVDLHDKATAAAVDGDLGQLQDALLDIHRHGAARAKRRSAANLVAAVAFGHGRLAWLHGFDANLPRQLPGGDFAVAVHEDDERAGVLVLHDEGFDHGVRAQPQRRRALQGAAVGLVVIGVAGVRHAICW